jgi:hypothetical protein
LTPDDLMVLLPWLIFAAAIALIGWRLLAGRWGCHWSWRRPRRRRLTAALTVR